MGKAFQGLAKVQAHLYFQDFLRFMKDLHATQGSISAGLSSPQKEYDALVPRCRLRLYPQCCPMYGPVALQWGTLITLKRSRHSAADQFRSERKVPRYLKRPFDRSWAHTFAKRSDLADRFVDFDRRALALNGATKVIFQALQPLKTSTIAKFSPHFSLSSPWQAVYEERVVDTLVSDLAPKP